MLKKYIRSHWRSICVFGLFGAVTAVIFGLYHLPLAAVGYAAAICGFLGLVCLVPDYLRFCKRCRRLEGLKMEILTTLESLPEPEHAVEEGYQELLRILYEEKQQLSARQEKRYEDLAEYYSMWAHQIKTPIAAMRLILQSAETEVSDVLCRYEEVCSVTEHEHQTGSEETTAETDQDGPDSLHYRGNIRNISELYQQTGQELKDELVRIEQYVEMVMCYLRLDAGTTDYVIREYDLDAIVRQAVRKNASLFIRKKLKLTYEPLAARVVTDEKWLLFVIEQVLSNALKYTVSGSITISLEQPKTLCIRDTGIGIAPEDLPRIFEKGYTGCNGRADKKASGIGLHLCRRICTNLGHKILATSQPGVGTEVRIDLKNAELEVE